MLDLEALAQLAPDDLEKTLAALVEHRKYNHADFWEPYPKQREFMALGKTNNERLLIAGNQLGKSDTGAFETYCHLTGFYPVWWEGRRWDRPIKAWVASESTTVSREVAQAKLCGPPGIDSGFGTGMIPKACFADKPTLARGAVADAYDTIQVYHHNKDGIRDGISTLQFKSYEQGRKKFQGSTIDFIWWDEEPPEDVYTEGNTRWSATGGMCVMTFTPLEGMSTVVLHYLEKVAERRIFVKFRASECPHMTPEVIAENKSKWPEHEWGARLDGDPMQGRGRVFRTDEAKIVFPVSQAIPQHWALIWGIDFGIAHPFAAVLGAWDRDADCIYLIAAYRAADALPLVHSEAVRRICALAPVAWPHDGWAREKGTGENLAKVYKALDLKMLHTHAQFPEGNYSTEAAVLEMQQRFADGRLKVREDLSDFIDEYRMYHRKATESDAGQLVKVRDDLLSACMKIVMMKRYAKPVGLGYVKRPDRRPRDPSELARDLDAWEDDL